MAELKAEISFDDPKSLSNIGRIYFKDNIVYINEIGKGIHIIDNHDPRTPKPLGFLNIPGNFDLSIIGNSLYADSYIDLVVFDISSLTNIREVKRMEGLFNHYQSLGFYADNQKGIVTDWKMVKNVSVQENDCKSQVQNWGGIYYKGGIALTDSYASSFSPQAAIQPTPTTGVGGSLARFTITQDHLYALDGSFLDVVDVAQPFSPVAKKEVTISWDVETLFPYRDKLFVGSRVGMHIFDLANPSQPTLYSQYSHILSCDPVVAEGDYAYVTLYGGSQCRVNTNELEIINIKDLKNPQLVKAYPMKNPHGVGIDNGTLFICDGSDGLKIYNATDVNNIQLIVQYKDIDALDVIPLNDLAMMIGSDGLYQYDYSDLKQIQFLSKLPIVK